MSSQETYERIVVPDDVATAAWRVIDNDSVLQDASHLNSTDSVFKGSVTRTDSLPRILVVGGLIVHDKYSGWADVTLDVQARARNVNDGIVSNDPLLNKLIKRVCFLIVGNGRLTKAGMRFFDVVLETTSPALEAPETNKESTMLARFSVGCRVD